MKNNTHHMREVELFLSFSLLCLTGIAGISAWPKKETALGYFHISNNAYGVAVYQDKAHATVEFNDADTFQVNGTTATISTLSTHPTITYGRDDIVFDRTGVVYTEPTQEEMNFLSQKLGVPVRKTPTSERKIPLALNTFYLVNPHVPGVLSVHTSQNATLWLDREKKYIKSEETATGLFTIQTYDALTPNLLTSN